MDNLNMDKKLSFKNIFNQKNFKIKKKKENIQI